MSPSVAVGPAVRTQPVCSRKQCWSTTCVSIDERRRLPSRKTDREDRTEPFRSARQPESLRIKARELRHENQKTTTEHFIRYNLFNLFRFSRHGSECEAYDRHRAWSVGWSVGVSESRRRTARQRLQRLPATADGTR